MFRVICESGLFSWEAHSLRWNAPNHDSIVLTCNIVSLNRIPQTVKARQSLEQQRHL